jgi:hypothetical protein
MDRPSRGKKSTT